MVVAVVSIVEFWWRWEGLALGGGVQVMGGSGEAATLAPHRGAGGGSNETVQLPAVLRAHKQDGNTGAAAGLTRASQSVPLKNLEAEKQTGRTCV